MKQMRVNRAHPRRASTRVAAAILLASCALAMGLFGPAIAAAASPVPTPDAGGDTRSAGEGPGLVGAPLLAIGGVLALGIVAAGITVVFVRATGGTRLATSLPEPPPAAAGTTLSEREDDAPGG